MRIQRTSLIRKYCFFIKTSKKKIIVFFLVHLVFLYWISSNKTLKYNFHFRSHERVDLTFYDAHSNGSHFDLGEIPLPVQTNISGQVLTGIAPIHIGSIQNASDILSTLPLTGTIINITHSDTSFINLSHRPSITENGTILNINDIAKIPGLNGTNAFLIDNTPKEYEDSSENDDDETTSSNELK